MSAKNDTDTALQGADGASKIRNALSASEPHRTPEERDAIKAWMAVLDAADEVAPSAAAIDYERTMIAHIMAIPHAMSEAGDKLRSEYFAQKELGEVLRVMMELDEANRPMDPTSVIERLTATSKMDAPWRDVLATCRRLHTTASTAREKATAVFQLWQNRRLAALGAALYHRARGASVGDADEILDEVSTQLLDLGEPEQARAVDRGIGESARAVWDETRERMISGRTIGPATGLPKLDFFMGGGIEPGAIIVVKAATGVGKTAFGLSVARNIALAACAAGEDEDHLRSMAVYCTLEMQDTQVAQRVIANEGSIDGMRIRIVSGSAGLTEEDIDRMTAATDRLQKLNGWMRTYHAPGLTIPGLRRYIKRLRRLYPDRRLILFIDYLQLMQVEGKRSREEEVASISSGVKKIATEDGVSFFLLSQVNADGRTRESKKIEQDADLILHIKPDDESADPVDAQFVYDCVVEKNRYGLCTNKYKVLFMKRYQRIVERAKETTESDGWWGKKS